MSANRVLIVGGWVGSVVVALVVGRFAAIDSRWDTYLLWAAIGGAVLLILSGLTAHRERQRLSITPAHRPRLPIVRLVVVVAVIVLLNVLAGSYRMRWDVTPTRMYELAPATRASLRRLDAPLHVLLFAQASDQAAYRDRLEEYSKASRLVSVDYIDVEAQPMIVRQYDIQEYGTAILDYKGRIERIRAGSEQEFTNAVTRLRSGRTRNVYFTTGHAERDTASTERVGYSTAAATLLHENFSIEKINLAQQGDVPPDATLVIVAGPRADFFRAEVEALGRYVDKGGPVLFLVDPFEDLKRYITESGMALFMMDPSSASNTGELKNLIAFIQERGVELGNDVVVDTSEMGQFLGTDASVPVAASYPPHPITRGLTSLSAYPMARSVMPASGEAGKRAQSIIETSDRSWSEKDIQQFAAGRLSMDVDRGDRPGPVSLAVAVAAPLAGQSGGVPRQVRLVVVGDSDFVANYSANVPGNAEVFLSVVHWLVQENAVTIPARLPAERTLALTASEHRRIFWFAVLLLPGIVIGTGVYLWGKG